MKNCYTQGRMIPFSLEIPSSILFGPGSIRDVPSALESIGGRRVIVLSGRKWFSESGLKQNLERLLAKFKVEFRACVGGEPKSDGLEEIRDAVRSFSPEVILAVGGGSVLDTAKALSALAALPGCVEEYLEGKGGARSVDKRGIPWIAVPTTAGSGAEATKNAVIRSASLGVKRSIRSPHLLASAVVVDPELAMELPLFTTGISGLDAFTQLVEAYLSNRSIQPVRALVHDAFAPMLRALERLLEAPEDLAARTDAAYGALMSGIALSNAGLGAAHGFAAGIGGAYDIPHGLLCAIFLPHVLEANAEEIRRPLAELTEGLTAHGEPRDPVEWLAGRVVGLLRAYGLPTDLRGYGIPKGRAGELAEKSLGWSMKCNPRELSREEREGLLLKVI